MSPPPATKPLFGDVLAQARERWVREMVRRIADLGFDGYRRSDALALRVLVPRVLPLSTMATALGASRQATRKVVNGLVERDFARVHVDASDSRRRNIELTSKGRDYASVVIEVIRTLNEELAAKIDPAHLDVAREVLTFVRDNFGL